MQAPTTTHALVGDEPIHSAAEDRLGRLGFAERLAHDLSTYSSAQSLVAALYGPWGSGKTSLLNLIATTLANTAPNALGRSPLVIRFNPWHFTTIDQLLASFFLTVSRAIGLGSQAKLAKSIGTGVEALGAVLQLGRYTPFAPATEFGTLASKEIARFLKHGNTKTPDEIKDHINTQLERFDRRLFILIDDIDRLEPDLIALLMRLVRMSAAFRHTTYLLSFDNRVVSRALDRDGATGEEYLEKIVQIAYPVPIADRTSLEAALFSSLDKVIAELPEGRWERTRWSILYRDSIRHFVRNIRDIARYSNAVGLHLGTMGREVNPVDAFGIEALRTFTPTLYEFIRINKALFLDAEFLRIPRGEIDQVSHAKITAAIDGEDASHHEAAHNTIRFLFPQITRFNGGPRYAESDEDRRRRRVCVEDFFDRYFLFGIPQGEVSDEEINNFVSIAHNRENARTELDRLQEDERLGRFLERFDDLTGSVPPGAVAPILEALFGVADALPWESASSVSPELQITLTRVTTRLLRRIDNAEERRRIWAGVLESAPSLSSLTYVVGLLEQERQRGSMYALDAELQEESQTILVGRFVAEARSETLASAAKLNVILYRWRDWAGEEGPRAFVARLVEAPRGILELLLGFRSAASNSRGRYTRINRDSINDFCDAGIVEEAARDLLNGAHELTDEQSEALEIFLNPTDRTNPLDDW